MTQTTQDQVNQTAWDACDTFRGVVDAGQYKDYILVMLFLKYISDLWDEHVETYRQRYGGDEARIRRRLARERFVLPKSARFQTLYEQRNEPNIGELINIALEDIEDRNRAKARRSLPQHRLQFGGESRPDEGPEPPSQEPPRGLRQARPRPAAVQGNRRRHRGVLHLPDLALRVGCREEGGRVLHAVRRLPTPRQARRAEGR